MKVQELDPIEELRRLVQKHGSQKALAAALGVSDVFVCDMLKGRRPVPVSILQKLGLRTAVVKQ